MSRFHCFVIFLFFVVACGGATQSGEEYSVECENYDVTVETSSDISVEFEVHDKNDEEQYVDGGDTNEEEQFVDECDINEDCGIDICECSDDGKICSLNWCVEGKCVEHEFFQHCPYGCEDGECNQPSCVDDLGCDDGDPCTDDSCHESGVCIYYEVADCISCEVDESCDDQNMCTEDICQDNICVYVPLEVTSNITPCTDDDVCSNEYCSFISGECEYDEVCLGDATACIPNDNVESGFECVFLCNIEGYCDDNDACTIDTCDSYGVCHHDQNNDVCEEGWECVNAPTLEMGFDCMWPCESDNDCEEIRYCKEDWAYYQFGTCFNGYCSEVDTLCEDYCLNGECYEYECNSDFDCDDGNACTLDKCNQFVDGVEVWQCENSHSNDKCNEGWTCFPNGNEFVCRVACEGDADCEEKQYCDANFLISFTGECQNNQYCSMGISECYYGGCDDGKCYECNHETHCYTDNPCLVSSCDDHECNYVTRPDYSSCSDDNTLAVCVNGDCQIFNECNDNNPCTNDSVSEVGCLNIVGTICPSDLDCVPNIFGGYNCEDLCEFNSECDDDNICTNDICLPSGQCVNEDKLTCKFCDTDDDCRAIENFCVDDWRVRYENSHCGENGVCSINSNRCKYGCYNGECVDGCDSDNECDDSDSCTNDYCDLLSNKCVFENSVCNDGWECLYTYNPYDNEAVCMPEDGSNISCETDDDCGDAWCVDDIEGIDSQCLKCVPFSNEQSCRSIIDVGCTPENPICDISVIIGDDGGVIPVAECVACENDNDCDGEDIHCSYGQCVHYDYLCNNFVMCADNQYCLNGRCEWYECFADQDCDDGCNCTNDYCDELTGTCHNDEVIGDCIEFEGSRCENTNYLNTKFDRILMRLSDYSQGSQTSSMEIYFDMSAAMGEAFGTGDSFVVDFSAANASPFEDGFYLGHTDPISDVAIHVVKNCEVCEALWDHDYDSGTVYTVGTGCLHSDFVGTYDDGRYVFTACDLDVPINGSDAIRLILGTENGDISKLNLVNPSEKGETAEVIFAVYDSNGVTYGDDSIILNMETKKFLIY